MPKIDNMLSMSKQFFNQKSPNEIIQKLAEKIKYQRKKLKLSQEQLALKSGVSLGSIKRFETKFEISFASFIKILIALDLEQNLDNLVPTKTYSSIEEVIRDIEE